MKRADKAWTNLEPSIQLAFVTPQNEILKINAEAHEFEISLDEE